MSYAFGVVVVRDFIEDLSHHHNALMYICGFPFPVLWESNTRFENMFVYVSVCSTCCTNDAICKICGVLQSSIYIIWTEIQIYIPAQWLVFLLHISALLYYTQMRVIRIDCIKFPYVEERTLLLEVHIHYMWLLNHSLYGIYIYIPVPGGGAALKNKLVNETLFSLSVSVSLLRRLITIIIIALNM